MTDNKYQVERVLPSSSIETFVNILNAETTLIYATSALDSNPTDDWAIDIPAGVETGDVRYLLLDRGDLPLSRVVVKCHRGLFVNNGTMGTSFPLTPLQGKTKGGVKLTWVGTYWLVDGYIGSI